MGKILVDQHLISQTSGNRVSNDAFGTAFQAGGCLIFNTSFGDVHLFIVKLHETNQKNQSTNDNAGNISLNNTLKNQPTNRRMHYAIDCPTP